MKQKEAMFDDMYLKLMTRCVAEMVIAREIHPMFKYSLNWNLQKDTHLGIKVKKD